MLVDPVAEIVAVGNGFIVTVAVPDWACEHPLASATLINVYAFVPEVALDTETVAVFPEDTTVWFEPPFKL